MTQEEADRLKSQVDRMTWIQLLALWKWLTLALWERMSKGAIGKDGEYV